MDNTSPRFKINGVDLYKTIRGAFITLVAVAITAVLTFVQSKYQGLSYVICWVDENCFNFAFIAVPLIGSILELSRRFVVDFSNK